MRILINIFTNFPLVAALLGVLIAQGLKPFIHKLLHGKWNIASVLSTGGMPSSHSASVMALTTAVGLRHGLSSSLFAIAMTLGMIVMYDAAGIRRHAGEQAMAINKLEAEFEKHIESRGPSHHFHWKKSKQLKEMLGHQPTEVLAGAILGICIGVFTWRLW
ncbi:divergent PAP2 family protein [Fodinisporobacter ferrooxydans]|uniref:Divergent PAP2 family protein n=1 Tax=Fodinisporobacter ferrooxydans TaxID=2901836 RepID=A0ABY4CMN8_9BACL|nr:divergent PAP2 family protein [Alicyclobacillaceae bacterium MYW30-H2]